MRPSGTRSYASAACALLLSCTIGSHSYARVSWHWGAGSQSTKALTASGGKSVYRSAISLNGANADLAVFSFSDPTTQLIARLKRLFKDADFKFRGGRMAFCLTNDGSTVLRMIILKVSDSSQTLLIKVEQTARDYEASKAPPDKHLIREVPEFPGSKPSFYAKNKDTEFQIAASTAPAAPADIAAFYANTLSAQGWENPLQDSASLQFFVKGSAVCMVMASRQERTGSSSITLLHKTHGVK